MSDNEENTRLVVVSNRLPVAIKKEGDEWKVVHGSGGLVSAMAPVLRNRGGTWIGWSGASEDVDADSLLSGFYKQAGYDLQPVHLSEEEVKNFYFGFSNEIIWPLFHDFQSRCKFKPDYWHTYLRVNRKYAEQAANVAGEDDYIWVHDYHLMHMAFMFKEMGLKRRTGFYLHIPFPPLDMFLKLPWRAKIIRALLEFDLVGFQTLRDRKNFVQCVKLFHPEAKARGRGTVITLVLNERTVRIGGFPIGIDYKSFNDAAKKESVIKKAKDFKAAFKGRKVILGVDRLDYTKGIPERLHAMHIALEEYPELRGKISLVQVVVPSREKVPEYAVLKEEIERLVGRINGPYTRPGYVPIHYQYRSLERDELIAYYRAADMALITPLRDGMNLVAKEYCACNVEKKGVLFLSEFAGAAAQLQNGAVLVNPHHVEGVAKAIHNACDMDKKECRSRMTRMQETVKKNDIFNWVDSFLEAAFSKNLDDFPALDKVDHAYSEGEEYV